MSDVRITITDNGPYKVEGAVQLITGSGDAIETRRETVFLCRCGASTKKPFCDGTHSKIGFAAAAAVVPESAE